MNQNEPGKAQLSVREKWMITGVTGLFAAVGAVFGVIAYYQQWLG